jgi:mannose-6-phosphate isomerase
MSDILRIRPVIKDYPWGNDYFIADLRDLAKDGPRAEMWMGAHRQGSAVIEENGMPLCDYMDANPGFCGMDADSFPFLFKVLAIAQSLSIQCHPDAELARAGFASETGKHDKLPRKEWNYQDSNQKAEMLYALTPVTAMCGFREFEQMKALLQTAVPAFWQEHLSDAASAGELFDIIYRMDAGTLSFAEAELLGNCDLLPEDVCGIVRELGDRYFGDPGVFSPLLLNIVHLEPGQAVYLKPRILHAYIAGNGVELMNNSDNVLRAGLTKKHMDLNELEHVMIPETYIPHPMDSTTDEGGRHFVCEGGFTLTVMTDGKYVNRGNGPRILLCTEGKADINGLVLEKGQCCIAGDAVKEIDVSCPGGTVFMASGC